MQKVFLIFALLHICLSASAQSPASVIDVEHYTFKLRLSDSSKLIKGEADIAVRFLKDAKAISFDLAYKGPDGKGMQVLSVTEGGTNLQFSQSNDAVSISTAARAGSEHNYMIIYQGVPADGLIISQNRYGRRTFFGDNWPNRAHDWLPCIDCPADKATVDFTVTAPDHYQVVANGLKIGETSMPGHLKTTRWKEAVPIPTKVMVIGMADFAVGHSGDSGITPVYSYVFPENKAEGFKSYASAKNILAYYNAQFGPYAYEKLANVQSKTIFGGMENASCIFYYEGSVNAPDIEALMAHEIAHQWFGDAVTEKSFGHLWLSEGFATYMADVYLENKYGGDTLKRRMADERQKVWEFEKKRTTPVVDTAVTGDYMQLLNPNSYEKGGWVLHMLRRKLGNGAFWNGIRAYYAQYRNSNADTEDLRRVMEQASGQNLQQFFKQWLYNPGMPDISYTQQYNKAAKILEIIIVQNQQELFTFPLQVSVNGKLHTVQIAEKVTHLRIAEASDTNKVVPDPEVNLLAHFRNIN